MDFDSPRARGRAAAIAIAGVLIALAYGVASRFVFETRGNPPGVLVAGYVAMSLCFLFLVPFVLGAVTAFFAPRRSRWRWAGWIGLPLVACMLLMGAVLLLAWEGFLCIAMASPIFLFMSMLGGAAMGGLIAIDESSRAHRSAGVVASLVVLPFVLAPAEGRLRTPEADRVVRTSIAIDADAATVGRQIVRVPAIAPSEQPPARFGRIGVPRPLEATLTHEGVGGVRHARFESGLRFEETVTEWTPGQGFAFDIRVDPDSIGATLDRHVRVGGEYFDVLEGRFSIEPAPRGVVLHLESRHRLTTRFNAYAALWTDAIMRDIHETVCSVVKRRSEASADWSLANGPTATGQGDNQSVGAMATELR
jgi:hypothetical protein